MRPLKKIAVAAFVVALAAGGSAGLFAQSNASLDELLTGANKLRSERSFAKFEEQLQASGVAYADSLPAIEDVNENLYVYLLQKAMTAQGTKLNASGVLNKSTTRAVSEFCKAQNLGDACASGVMNKQAAAAIGGALDKLMAPATPVAATETTTTTTTDAVAPTPATQEGTATAEATPAAGTDTAAAAPAAPALPEGWMITRDTASGITATVTEVTADAALIHWQGVAQNTGYSNLFIGGSQPAAMGETWTVSVNTSDLATANTGAVELTLRALLAKDGSYVRELARPPADLLAGTAQSTIQGTIDVDANEARPYIQLKYEAGATVDVTVRVATPTFSKS